MTGVLMRQMNPHTSETGPKQLYSHLQCARHWPCPQKVKNPVSNSPKQSEGPRQSFSLTHTCFWPQPLLLSFFPIIHINSQTKYHSCHFERQGYPVTGTWVFTLHFLSCFFFSPSLLRWRTRHLTFEAHGAPATAGWIPVVMLHQDLTFPTTSPLPAAEEWWCHPAAFCRAFPAWPCVRTTISADSLRIAGRGCISLWLQDEIPRGKSISRIKFFLAGGWRNE